MDASPPASDRVRLRRGAARGDHDPATVRSILRAGLVAHVGVDTPDGPLVLPMAYGLTETALYLHGATANGLLRGAHEREVCVTVTIVDGLVVARSPFHHSMNYRSVVVRGRARLVDDPDEHLLALRLVTDHVVETWATTRPPSPTELRRTQVVAVPLDEASAKVRSGDPVDDPADLHGPHWAGVVPVITQFGAPVPSRDLRHSAAPPTALAELAERPSSGPNRDGRDPGQSAGGKGSSASSR